MPAHFNYSNYLDKMRIRLNYVKKIVHWKQKQMLYPLSQEKLVTCNASLYVATLLAWSQKYCFWTGPNTAALIIKTALNAWQDLKIQVTVRLEAIDQSVLRSKISKQIVNNVTCVYATRPPLRTTKGFWYQGIYLIINLLEINDWLLLICSTLCVFWIEASKKFKIMITTAFVKCVFMKCSYFLPSLIYAHF